MKRNIISSSALIAVTLLATDAFAAGAPGEGFPWLHWAVSMFNFIVFLGIIAYFGGPKIQGYFAGRRDDLLKDREESKRLREAAEAKFEEYSKRLDKLEDERKELMDEYHKQGEAEKDRLIAEAKKQVEKMRSDAELMIKQETRRAVAAIEQQAVDLAIQLATEQVEGKVDAGTQGKMVDAYVADLNKMDGAAV